MMRSVPSVDGTPKQNGTRHPMHRILRNLQPPLFERQRAMQVTARVTVTPKSWFAADARYLSGGRILQRRLPRRCCMRQDPPSR